MEFRFICQAELTTFDFHQFSNKELAISPARLNSYTQLSLIRKDDIVLILAIEGDFLCGYLGMFPDEVFIDGKMERMGWPSCFWVSPDFRRRGIGKMLFEIGIQSWNGNVMVTAFSPPSKAVQEQIESIILKVRIGKRYYLRSCLKDLLPDRIHFFSNKQGFLKFVDGFNNIFFRATLKLKTDKTFQSEYRAVWSSLCDSKVQVLLDQEKNYFNLTTDKISERIANPWIAARKKPDNQLYTYHFNEYSPDFLQQFVYLYKSEEMIGFALLNRMNGQVKIPCFYGDSKAKRILSELILKKLVTWKVNYVSTYNRDLITLLDDRVMVKKQITGGYFIPKKWINSIDVNEFQDGAGDVFFT